MKKYIAIVGVALTMFGISHTALAASKPMAQCKDKTYSYSANRKGTCSHHKGVLKWLK